MCLTGAELAVCIFGLLGSFLFTELFGQVSGIIKIIFGVGSIAICVFAGLLLLDIRKLIAEKLTLPFELVSYLNSDSFTKSLGKGEWENRFWGGKSARIRQSDPSRSEAMRPCSG